MRASRATSFYQIKGGDDPEDPGYHERVKTEAFRRKRCKEARDAARRAV